MKDVEGKELNDTQNIGTVVSVRRVCFAYGEHEVLHQASFEIPYRAMVAVVGPNGGGKTTLMNLLLGALKPRYGEIEVLGGCPNMVRNRIGYVPQHVHFDPTFPITVLDSVMLGRASEQTWGGFNREDRRRAREALEIVKLSHKSQALFSELSGGERQRVLIAQALSRDTELLLLDEPTANVDTQTEMELYSLFRELNQTRTILIVSHDLHVVVSNATHILCVNRTADIHDVACDDVAELVPMLGNQALSWINNRHPNHLNQLLEERTKERDGETN